MSSSVNDSSEKAIPPVVWFIAAMVYVVCPLDLDFIPIIGWIDDLVVAYMGIYQWRAGVAAQNAEPKAKLPADEGGAK